MNLPRIREIMKNIDIDLPSSRVVSMPHYASFLSNSYGLSVMDMEQSETDSALKHIDDLVNLRNDISHGVGNLESIEKNEIVRERAAKLGAFANALNEILICEVFSCRISLGQLIPVHGNVQVFDDHIACFSWLKGDLPR